MMHACLALARRLAAGTLLAGTLFASATANAGEEISQQPEVFGRRLDGTPYSLAESRGRVTVLAVWSPDSLASRKSLSELNRFNTSYASRGVTTIALATAGDVARLQEFVRIYGFEVPVVILGEHQLGPLPMELMPIIGAFDRSGTLRAAHGGLFRLRQIEKLVEPLLAE